MKIGIIGNGFVGKATNILKNKDVEIITYDINPHLCDPQGTSLEEFKSCELIFISVPTPMNDDNSCHIGIVESVVKKLTDEVKICEPVNFIIIRSTVIPGTSDDLGCYFMPEFLTEKNYVQDFRNCKEWIIGLRGTQYDEIFMTKINKLFTLSKMNGCILSDSTNFVLNKEAEMIKYFRNCFLALKISFCNEIYDYCRLQNIDYEQVKLYATKDNRIGSSHSNVPGHDGSRGYGGTCLSKDTKAIISSMKKIGLTSYILDAMDRRNDIDRSQQLKDTDTT